MKMEHYLAHTDYPIWEVIQNGNGPVSITTDTSGQIKVLPPRTAEEIVARERERKARTTLLMALPEDHLAKFHKMTDAKERECLPKLKYFNDQLCSSCEMSKAKRGSFKSKAVPSSKGRLNLLHMDLYTWTLFLRSKDETPEVLKDFLTMIQRNLQAQVISVRTDRGTEFLNKTLHAYFKEEGIEHQTSTPRTPEQNGVVERRNRTMDKVLRTMLQILSFIIILGCGRSFNHPCLLRKIQSHIGLMEKTVYHIIIDRETFNKTSSHLWFHLVINRDWGEIWIR
ncbi:retrovirus-related pol polyprotein from transposon TNT 1-94 [Tanacetum coccineum]|uniref:Retrovirus-related pol polyprotein from transposon TNT 1-94 n=1 Tax=Tanacetum coccineum TaxID=301880 RepID=A0ABQ5G809_9ASTR